ncbi:hypothetical protein TanjilG_11890 [Lupinus angustifolius]|uniref:Uncharacterized protein n=1 Tax=Lupinus angustifolius TaxID=3871 RepID=A0A1J7H553_LUPAN|nr:hypothetical protein TanjilG_11890 [Lupinus angustifolius]
MPCRWRNSRLMSHSPNLLVVHESLMVELKPIKEYRRYMPQRLSRDVFLQWIFTVARRRDLTKGDSGVPTQNCSTKTKSF